MGALTLAAFGGAISGVTSAFFRKALDSGDKWFGESLKDHQPQAIEKANVNVMAFLDLLKRKIERLEKDAAGMEERLNRIRTAMDEPSFAFCFKTAMLQAALTSDSTKQTVLARCVAERLASAEDNLLSILIHQACESIGVLTSSQLRILAIANWVSVQVRESESYANPTITFVTEHIVPTIRRLAPVSAISRLDLDHLCATSCFAELSARDCEWLEYLCLHPEESNCRDDDCARILMGIRWGDVQERGGFLLTPKGCVIGTCVSDLLTDSNTDLSDTLGLISDW